MNVFSRALPSLCVLILKPTATADVLANICLLSGPADEEELNQVTGVEFVSSDECKSDIFLPFLSDFVQLLRKTSGSFAAEC